MIFLFSDSYAQIKDGVAPTPVTASITARGIVLSPISVTSTHDLDFGNDILPGINRVIDKNSNSAGKFSIMGEAGKEVNISIKTPEFLYSGTNSLPINFSQTDGGYKVTGGSVVDFDPANPVNANIGTDGLLDIYLGGTVVPAYQQEGGEYQGTVIVEFIYTGN
jgi:hypothetical protein